MTQQEFEALAKVHEHLVFAQGVLIQTNTTDTFSLAYWKLIKVTEFVEKQLLTYHDTPDDTLHQSITEL